MSQQSEHLYEFGNFRLHPVRRLLLRDDKPVPVTSKVFDLLLLLIENGGQVVPKEQLMKQLWPDTVVEENNLTQQISTLRRVLGERTGEHLYVVTIPGRGYSFVADVRKPDIEHTDVVLQQHSTSLITIDVEEESDELQPESKIHENAAFQIPPHSKTGRLTKYQIFLPLVAILVGVIIFLGVHQVKSLRQRASSAHPKSIAVLPFKSLNPSTEDAFLGPGMTDTLIAKLSNIHQITVRPTSSVIKYVGANPDSLVAGRDLGVDSVLEGTLQRSGERVRVTVQLLSVADGKPLWAESFDAHINDIFTVQDTISEQVAQTMLMKLNGDEQQKLRKHYTENVAAYQAYLRGRYFWNKRDEANLKKSIEYFQHAIATDPSYALAYAGMADAYHVIISYGFDSSLRQAHILKVKEATLKAIQLDGSLAEVHTSLALIKFNYDTDSTGAEQEYKEAINLNPNYATAHHWYADYLLMKYRREEGMAEIRRAQELDPLSPIINMTLGEHLYYDRRYDEAVDQFRKTLEIDPNFFQAHHFLGLAFEQKGQYEEAVNELKKAKEQSGRAPGVIASLGHAYAMAGHKLEAQHQLAELLKLGETCRWEIAVVYLGLGEKQQTLDWLRKLPADQADWVIKLDPRMKELRSDWHSIDLARS